MNKWAAVVDWLIVVGLVGVLWESIRFIFCPPDGLMPSALAIGIHLVDIVPTVEFWLNVSSTLRRTILGFLLGASLGVAFGTLVGIGGKRMRAALFAIDFFRSIPISTLYPLFIILFSIGEASKIMMVAYATFFIVALNAAIGVIQAPSERSQIAKLAGISTLRIAFYVSLPEAIKQISAGLQTTLSIAFIVAILLEMFMGAQYGIGQMIMESYSVYDGMTMNSFILTSGIIGLALNAALRFFQAEFVPWGNLE